MMGFVEEGGKKTGSVARRRSGVRRFLTASWSASRKSAASAWPLPV
jgi:hypothetical protein